MTHKWKPPPTSRALDVMAARIARGVDRLRAAITPIFVPSERRNDLELVGSGFLLRVGPAQFVVTAAHVMDIAQGRLYVGGESKISPIGGQYSSTVAPGGGRDRDRFDLAVVPLSDSEMTGFRDCRFLTLADLDANEVPDHRQAYGGHYLLLGYPVTRQRATRDGVVRVLPLAFAGRAIPAQRATALGWSELEHRIIEYDKKQAWTRLGRTTPPDPFGVSGGGIFRLYGRLRGEKEDERLVAVAVRYDRSNGRAVIDTKVKYLLSGIATRYPHLRGHLE